MTCSRSPHLIKYRIILQSIGFNTYALFSSGQEYVKLVSINFRVAYEKLVSFNSGSGKLVWRNFGKLVLGNFGKSVTTPPPLALAQKFAPKLFHGFTRPFFLRKPFSTGWGYRKNRYRKFPQISHT